MVADSPSVGRTEELGALLDAVQRTVRGGRPAAAVVVGDPGCGKSRLLAEVVARVGVETKLRVRPWLRARAGGALRWSQRSAASARPGPRVRGPALAADTRSATTVDLVMETALHLESRS
jgi:AAA ATPase-like protein